MEGTEPDQVRAVRLQCDPAGLGEPLDADLTLQPLKLGCRNPRHGNPRSAKPCQERAAPFLTRAQNTRIMCVDASDPA